MRKRMRMRIKSRKGFTIGEMLVAVLILVMVSAVVAAGLPAAANAYYKVVDSANAQMLLSTTLTKLRSELSTATNVGCSGTTVSYRSAAGSLSEITLVIAASGDEEGGDGSGEDQVSGIFVERVNLSQKQLLVSLKAASGMYMTYDSVTGPEIETEYGVLTFHNLTVMKGDKQLATLDNYKIRVLTKLKTENEDGT